jgi:mannose-6-phosphate isomerase-like protein (cupin superfamily)
MVFDTHVHEMDKIDAVVSGKFAVTMEGETVELGPGDAVHVPRGVAHQARVVGDQSVVSFDAVKVPRRSG